MRLGVPKEIKPDEYRVGLTPANVWELNQQGHQVLVETQCGDAIGFTDQDYVSAGARLVPTPEAVYAADFIVKVKEPQPSECQLLRPGQMVFAYLHLAADKKLTQALIQSKVTAIAYETVTDAQGHLPLLAPMSEVAGRVATQAGAHHLELAHGGQGILMGGVPGVAPARVLVIGGGVVGTEAARIAVGMGADVTIADISLPRLRELDARFDGRVRCEYASGERLDALTAQAQLIIGAVLVPGAAAPKLLSEAQVKRLAPGTLLVDVAIDQGGCFATSRPTSHKDPTYVVHGVLHYAVSNIPSAVARTATLALTNATLPYVRRLAEEGAQAWREKGPLCAGVNTHAGHLTHEAVADSLGLCYQEP